MHILFLDGHGMPIIFLAAKGLAQMIRTGKKFEEVNLLNG
jgi:hypothetical protein